MIATIETERLTLRPLREEHRGALIEIHTDPRANLFTPDPPDEAQADAMVTTWLAHWAECGFGYWAVTERDAAEVIGLAGIRTRVFHGEQALNMAYRFRPEAWGRGYAAEAARGVLGWRARELPSVPVVATIDVANAASIRVAERIGFTTYTEELEDGAPVRHYRL